MLHELIVDLAESEPVVPVAVIVRGDGVKAASARVAGRRPPVEANGRLRVQVRRRFRDAGERRWCVELLDRRQSSTCALRRPLRELDATADHQQAARGPDRQQRGSVTVLEPVVGAIRDGRVWSNPIEADLRRLAPAADDRQLPATVEEARGQEFGLGSLVARDAVAAPHIDIVVRTDVVHASHANREPIAVRGALEERMPRHRAVDEHVFDPGISRSVAVGTYGCSACPFSAWLTLTSASRVSVSGSCAATVVAAPASSATNADTLRRPTARIGIILFVSRRSCFLKADTTSDSVSAWPAIAWRAGNYRH